MPSTDKIASRFIERSLELFRRRLWLEYESSECFLLDVPTADHPLVASILGQGGEDHGIVFTRGENALADMLELVTGFDDDEVVEGIHWLGFSIGPYAEIPTSLRKIHQLARFTARRGTLAPLIVSKPSYKFPRNPDRTEQRTLLYGINAALIAHDRGALKPRCILTSKQLLKITATGSPTDPGIKAGFVKALKTPSAAKQESSFVPPPPPELTGLPRIADALGEHRGGADEVDEPADPDLAAWRAADERLTRRLVEALDGSKRSIPRARRRYFGDDDPSAPPGDLHLTATIGFYEWAIFADRLTHRARTIAETVLALGDLTRRERKLLRSRMDATTSIYRVVDVDPGVDVTLEDVVDGQRITTPDHDMSLSAPVGMLIPMRAYVAGSFTFCLVIGPPIVHLDVPAICDELAEADPAKRLALVGELWHYLGDDGATVMPAMVTAHGDPIEPLTAIFHVRDIPALEQVLNHRPDVDYDDQNALYRWLLTAPSHWPGDEITAASLALLGNELRVEVHARRRLDAVREWLEAIDGVAFERERPTTAGPPCADDDLPTLPDEATTRGVIEALEDMVHNHYEKWVDLRIPALDDLTPREACKTPKGGRKVARMIRTMPSVPGPTGGTIEPPREALLEELGLNVAEGSA